MSAPGQTRPWADVDPMSDSPESGRRAEIGCTAQTCQTRTSGVPLQSRGVWNSASSVRRIPLTEVVESAEPHEWRATCRCSAIGGRSLDREPTWAMFARSVSLPRRRDRIHSAVPDCLGSARGGKKCDQSLEPSMSPEPATTAAENVWTNWISAARLPAKSTPRACTISLTGMTARSAPPAATMPVASVPRGVTLTLIFPRCRAAEKDRS
jgi:hypothetical protein